MLSSLNLKICRSGPSGNHKILSFYLIILWIVCIRLRQFSSFDVLMDDLRIFGADDGILIFESGQTVEIVHLFNLVDIGHISKVDRFDIALYFAAQFVPVEIRRDVFGLALVYTQLPSVVMGIDYVVVSFGGFVH